MKVVIELVQENLIQPRDVDASTMGPLNPLQPIIQEVSPSLAGPTLPALLFLWDQLL